MPFFDPTLLLDDAATATTPRLIVRPLSEKDRQAVEKLVRGCSSVRGRVPFPCRIEGEGPIEFFERSLQEMQTGTSSTFVVQLLMKAEAEASEEEEGAALTIIGLTSIDANLELGFWFSRNNWGKGLLGEAISATVHEFGFQLLHLKQVRIHILEDNEPSRHVFESLGFMERGIREIMGDGKRQVIYEMDNSKLWQGSGAFQRRTRGHYIHSTRYS